MIGKKNAPDPPHTIILSLLPSPLFCLGDACVVGAPLPPPHTHRTHSNGPCEPALQHYGQRTVRPVYSTSCSVQCTVLLYFCSTHCSINCSMHVLFFPLSDRELVVEICFGDCLCTLWPHTLLGAQLFILPLHFREETSKVI